MSNIRDPLYRCHRFPPEVISTVWLYYRFPLSLLDGRGDAGGPWHLR
jgi:hypothetical protein